MSPRNPLFQVMFVLQNTPGITSRDPRFSLEPEILDIGVAHFDLTLIVRQVEGSFQLIFEYNTDLYHGESIARWIRHYEFLLRAMVENGEQRVDHVPLLPPTEKEKVLVDWNKNRHPLR